MIRVTCFSCNAPFRRQYSPFFCVKPDCLAVCHRQEMCYGLPRTEQKRGGWRCYLHDGRDLRRGDNDDHQEPGFGKCAEYDKTLKSGMSLRLYAANAKTCRMHHVQRWMTRDQIIKKRNCKPWICSVCCTQENSIWGSTNPPPLERSRCCKFKKTICRGVERMHCNNCDKESHKGCTGLKRDAYQSLLDNNAWTCERCYFYTPPGFNTIPTDQSTDGGGPKKTESNRNLRGLRWNASGINTKVAELNRLAVELDVDVVPTYIRNGAF